MRKFAVIVLILIGFIFPSTSHAYHVDLKPCIEVSHCAIQELDVENIDQPFERIKNIIENTPRSIIVELEDKYLHAEVTSKWMKYVDDLEVSYNPEMYKILIRSESRVGEGDLGVNKKRIDSINLKILN